ncbi:hypothetical protein HUS23_07040 [Ectothiorhodospiraceae bacterium 2226]|nr:hypothetical protein HUS23_07040 [Ectothiorhodospiraceae bacterium 2226]
MSPAKERGSRRLIIGLGVAVVVLGLLYAGWQAWGPRDDGAPDEAARTETVRPADRPPDGPQQEVDPTREAPPFEDAAPAEEADEIAWDALQAHEVLAHMRAVWECYANADCTLGADTDPRAEYFEAGERLAAAMRALNEQHRDHRISDPELAAAALEVLAYDSGPARAEAIQALRALPPSDAHLDALLTTLDQHHDEKLFELALPDLQRYAEQGRRDEVDEFLQSNLRRGAQFPARTIARQLGPFLTPENIAEYRALAEELPEDSRHRALLMETLAEYEGSD